MDSQQRRRQIGRIHQAAKALGLGDGEYRSLMETLTGCRSCRDMSDRQVNHVLDWLNFMQGRRHARPAAFGKITARGSTRENLVHLCYAVAKIVPPGYTVNPITSSTWQQRTCGRWATAFESFEVEELWKLLEGLKAIFRRAGQRDTESLDDKALDSRQDAQPGRHVRRAIDGNQRVSGGRLPFSEAS